MAKERLLVVGGNAAGMSAASQARRLRPDLDIVAIERGPYTSYSTCGIPYYVADLVGPLSALIARTPEQFRDQHRIDARTGHTALAVDCTAQRLDICDAAGHSYREAYDHLLLACGARPIRPALPGVDGAGIYGVATLADGEQIHQAIAQHQPRRAVVIGGGYIGLEMAEALVRRGLEVALVEAGPQVMKTLDPDMGALVADALREIGVALYLGERVEGFELNHGQVCAVTTDQQQLPADIVILGLGVQPNTTLAEQAGIPLGVKQAIKVNPRLQSEVDNIWAAGDCAESFHRISRQPVHIALGTVANKQGLTAGINLGGRYATFPGVVGTAVSKICKFEVARTGLQEQEIEALGLAYVTASIDSQTRASYYPDAGEIRVKLLAERGSGRLLGGQIVGVEGAAKRIDVLACALWAEFDVQTLIGMDLSYAPPYSPVWDPVQIAARRLVKEL